MSSIEINKYFLGLTLMTIVHFQMQAQDSLFPELVGEALIEKVVESYKPTSVLSYGDARDVMYSSIYNVNDSVTCVYSGHQIYLPNGVDPTAFLYMNGSNDGINAEHTYPRSKGADFGNPLSDMHHLFPTRAAVNAGRGNSPFGEINDGQTNKWYYLDNEQSNIPNTNIDLYSEEINTLFEPKESHKGNVARAVFYFISMYEQQASDADPNFFEPQKQTLCDWHEQDPADELELARTHMIATYQNDLPNPYVLDPTLAARAFCGAGPTSIESTINSEVSIFPNPIADVVQIQIAGTGSLKVIDLLGRNLFEESFRNFTEVNFSNLKSGTYFIWINGEAFKVLKR